MRVKLLPFILFFFFKTKVSNASFENIRDVSNSFNTLLASPSLEKYKKLKSVAGQTYRFATKVVPYGEAIAAVLKPIFDEDQLSEILETTKRIESTMGEIRVEQIMFFNELMTYHLHSDYYEKVTVPITRMFQLLNTIKGYNFRAPVDVINDFKSGCRLHYSPQVIAMYLKSVVINCEKPFVDPELVWKIYHHLLDSKYILHNVGKGKEKWFGIHSAAIYFRLLPLDEQGRERAFEKLRTLIESNLLFQESGLHLIRHELDDDIQRTEATTSGGCLAKSLFLKTEFNSTHLLTFAANLYQDFNLTLSLGVICANFTNPNNPKVAEDEANYVIQDLEPVADYLSQWIPQLLNGTWTDLEAILIKKELNRHANGFAIPRSNKTYDALRDKISAILLHVGEPLYTRHFFITPSLESDYWTWKPHITYGCKPGMCYATNAHGVHVFVTRTSLDDDKLAHKVDTFNQFVDDNSEVFRNAMSSMRTNLPDYIIEHLDTDYNFDVRFFTNNSFYLFFSVFSQSNVCPLHFSSHTPTFENNKMGRELGFYNFWEWYLFQAKCVNHALILTV